MKKLYSAFIYENPKPLLYAKNSMFPNICVLPDGKLLAAHQIGQAFESVDATTHLSESTDGGKTWSAPWRADMEGIDARPTSECAKITCLPDGRLVMIGYAFYRDDPEEGLGNAQTGGLLEDYVFWAESSDGGKTWSERREIPTKWNGHTEASAPIYVLHDGSWATPITGFPDWEGKMTSSVCGRLLRSYDAGKTWNDDVVCMEFPENAVLCYEQRMCQLDDGTIVVVAWNEDTATGMRMNNHITISTDNGKTFSKPIDTGIRGQATGIVALGGNRFMMLHAVRADTDRPGVYACIAEFDGQQYRAVSCECIWSPTAPVTKNNNFAEIFAFLKFGQPGAVRLPDGDILLHLWLCEEGCYKTQSTRYQM